MGVGILGVPVGIFIFARDGRMGILWVLVGFWSERVVFLVVPLASPARLRRRLMIDEIAFVPLPGLKNEERAARTNSVRGVSKRTIASAFSPFSLFTSHCSLLIAKVTSRVNNLHVPSRS
jgi:hypothetical protein